MVGLVRIAWAARTSDLWTFETPLDTTGGERRRLFVQPTPAKGPLLRVFIAEEQPRKQTPEPAKRPTICNVGTQLALSRKAADFFPKLKYEVEAIEPPYFPYPAPKLTTEPWAPDGAEFRGAVEADAACQKRCGVKKRDPLLGHVAVAPMGIIIAGELGVLSPNGPIRQMRR